MPSLHPIKFQKLVALAASCTFVPTIYVPLPVTVPPLVGLAIPRSAAVTVIVNCAAFAVVGDAQPAVEVNWQSSVSPLARPALLYVLPLPPTTTLFFFQT